MQKLNTFNFSYNFVFLILRFPNFNMNEIACTNDNENAGNTDLSNTLTLLNIDEFIKYSDSVDDRMAEMAKNHSEYKEKWTNWHSRRDFNEDDSDSEDEPHVSNVPPKYPSGQDRKHNPKAESAMKANNVDTNICYQSNAECCMSQSEITSEDNNCSKEQLLESENIYSDRNSVDALMKKFNVIEQLRHREEFRNEKEVEPIMLGPGKGKVHREPKQKLPKLKNPQEFFGCRKNTKKRSSEDDRESDDANDAYPEDEDNEIDKIAEMLSNSSLIKDYDDLAKYPNKEDDILNNFFASTDNEEESAFLNEKEFQNEDTLEDTYPFHKEEKSSQNSNLDVTASEWKDSVSQELNEIFGGYEVDDLSSFHDWMLDDFLSKSMKTTYDTGLPLCKKCFSILEDGHNCVQE